jgi:hypothetical protein
VSDPVLIVILLTAFAVAIGLVQVAGRLIDSGGRDGWADEPSDIGGTRADTASSVSRSSSWGRSERALSANRLRPGTVAGALCGGRARDGYPDRR